MISFGGLASGLDTNAIINALVQAESIPIQQLQAKKSEAQSKLDLIGTLKGHLKSLQEKAGKLSKLADFLAFKVSSSEEGVANFSVNGTAQPGSHTLEVLSMAQADRWAFDSVTDPDADLATADGQQLSFTVGSTQYDIAFNAGESSLAEIAQQINDLAGDDVSASVVNTGTGSNSYQLVLSAKTTGVDARISGITTDITGLGIDGSGPDGEGVAQSVNNITVGTNAVAIIDGLRVERLENSFNGVINGVDIDAISAEPGHEIQFTVEADPEVVKTQMNEFIDAYNEVMTFINGQNSYDEEEGAGGDLFGDSILRTVRNTLNDALFNLDLTTIQNDTEGYSTLGLIGIKSSSDGTLSMNETTFDEKLSENLQALADLFVDMDGFDNGGAEPNTPGFYTDTTSDTGLAARLDRAIDRLIDPVKIADGEYVDALFDSRTKTIKDSMTRYDKEIGNLERYLETFEEQQRARFASLEELMGQLNAQSQSLYSILNSI
jgi:flagellar hook-associated protein 2